MPSVKDIYGNAMNNFEVDGLNIDTTDIFIDNIPVSTTGATVSGCRPVRAMN